MSDNLSRPLDDRTVTGVIDALAAGQSIRQVAEIAGVSVHQVRQIADRFAGSIAEGRAERLDAVGARAAATVLVGLDQLAEIAADTTIAARDRIEAAKVALDGLARVAEISRLNQRIALAEQAAIDQRIHLRRRLAIEVEAQDDRFREHDRRRVSLLAELGVATEPDVDQ